MKHEKAINYPIYRSLKRVFLRCRAGPNSNLYPNSRGATCESVQEGDYTAEWGVYLQELSAAQERRGGHAVDWLP